MVKGTVKVAVTIRDLFVVIITVISHDACCYSKVVFYLISWLAAYPYSS
jgi:hypothetical protein